jgi:hypothetical protein
MSPVLKLVIIIFITILFIIIIARLASSTPELKTINNTPSTPSIQPSTPSTQPSTPSTQPSTSITQPSTSITQPNPVSSAVATVVAFCKGGSYCNGSSINPVDAQLGKTVCGGGNQIFNCEADGVWRLTGASCDNSNMPNKCATSVGAFCKYGSYCDGSSISPADAQLGKTVCGGGNQIFKCEADGVWWLTGASCANSNMVHKCAN